MEKRFFVVIHALSMDEYGPEAYVHIISSAEIAFENGAHGVFLIPDYAKGNFMARSYDLEQYYISLYQRYRDENFKIGVNFLSTKEFGFELIFLASQYQFQMIQMDGRSFISKQDFPEMEIFSGVAFKYSEGVNLTGDDLKSACQKVLEHATVPTTSGFKTGISPSLEKIKEIRKYLPSDCRLAIASGVSAENVSDFMEAGATDFLVASSLLKEKEDKMDILDSLAVKRLADIVRNHK